MLDLKFVRENPEIVKKNIKNTCQTGWYVIRFFLLTRKCRNGRRARFRF